MCHRKACRFSGISMDVNFTAKSNARFWHMPYDVANLALCQMFPEGEEQ
jgi:hypothetical protein